MDIRNIDRLPFFEVEEDPIDNRFGRIRVCHDEIGPMGVLDYFHGISSEIGDAFKDTQGFFVTRLSLSKEHVSNSLEKGLLYIAACIAEDAGEDVLYRRPGSAAPQKGESRFWEILGVRNLLGQYDSLVQSF